MILSKEEQLLLAVARLELSELDTRKLQKLLEDSPDWSAVMEMADLHCVTPLIYHHLKKAGNYYPAIPLQARKELKHAYYQNLLRNEILFHELKKILSELNEQGIKVIVLKGALFAEMLYKNPALRTMSDIDILVKPVDFEKVAAYLVNADYERSSDVEHIVRERRYHHAQFLKMGIMIEVHKGLAQPRRFKMDMDKIWKRSIPVSIDGVDALRLSNEDIILHLCLHMIYHKFIIYLIWWTDLYEFIKKFEADINWDYVVEKAIEQQISTAVYFSLYFVKRIMKAEIPAFVLNTLKASSLRKRTLFWFLNENSLSPYRFVGRPRIYQLFMELLLIDKLRNKVTFAVEFTLRSLELFFYKHR